MTCIDRYVARIFLAAYAICAAGFLSLYIVIDAFEHLDGFLNTGGSVAYAMAVHYATLVPLIFLRLAPAFTLLAAMFALVRLNKNNEVVAMKAAGVSTARLLLPILALAILLSGAIALDQEVVVPALAARSQGAASARAFRPPLLVDAQGRLFEADSYDPATRKATGVRVTRRTPDGREAEVAVARSAQWEEGRGWVLTDGMVRLHDKDGQILLGPDGRAETHPIPAGGTVAAIEITPLDLESQRGDLYYLPLRDLKNQWERRRLPHLLTQIHQRFAWPATNIVILLVGVPFAFRRQNASALVGVFQCLAICLAFFVVSFYTQTLGADGTLIPAVAAWLPLAMFGSAALALLSDVPS